VVSKTDGGFLVSKANKRVESGDIERPGISETDFLDIVKDQRKLCMRNVSLDGSPILGESEWRNFAYVTRILRDS
jgi:hypothetical protein